MPLADLLSLRLSAALALIAATATTAYAGGPRWVSGPPYFQNQGVMVTWSNTHPLYFTDPGDLSQFVSHADADALVSRAATVWNVPTASIVLAQGGTLNQHVSSANVSITSSGLQFPADVQSSPTPSKPIAVIYDTDGSVTDLLLGSGASEPGNCLQNAVIESVDGIQPSARITHAVLILNGRCTGPAPEQQLQMQYQLMRAFGRILGLAWSQTNDNVFTGSPVPSSNQALNWPIMHPIDIICGPYTYQCLPQPFTLRPDDLSALALLYFIPQGRAEPGKLDSGSNSGSLSGNLTFPNGQGMEGVNVVIRRLEQFYDTPEDWQSVSAVTGIGFRWQGNNRISAPASTVAASIGAVDPSREGTWAVGAIVVPTWESWEVAVITTEPINPLYIGAYAVGPNVGNTINPAGSSAIQISYVGDYGTNFVDTTRKNSPACADTSRTSESSPIAVPATGWWAGSLCNFQQPSWNSVQIKGNRSLTVEATALDENGQPTANKLMPVLGAWNSTDPIGTLPTVASTPAAFNGFAVGLTSLPVQVPTARTLRFAVSDQRASGRPDFNYAGRILYADSISPASVPASGGLVTISGMGFRQGNTVLVNGVPATVTSITPNNIVASVPTLSSLGTSRPTSASITVQDNVTGGTSVMTRVLSYAAPVDTLQLLATPTAASAPAVSDPAQAGSTNFIVKAIAADGVTAIVGEQITMSTSGADTTLSACGASTCSLLTNAYGLASTSVVARTAGLVSLSASGRSGVVTSSFTAVPQNDVLRVTSAPSGTATVGRSIATPFTVQVFAADGVTPRPAATVNFTATAGSTRLDLCGASTCTAVTDANGIASTTLTALVNGAQTISATTATASSTITIQAAPATLQLVSSPSGILTVGRPSATAFTARIPAGDGVTPLAGESVVLSATGSAVRFSACPGPVCTLQTDASGTATTSVTPLTPGTSTLSALGTAGSITAGITSGVATIIMLSAPTGILVQGSTAPVPFSIRVLLADGSPASGEPITFTATGASASFALCGQATCSTTTDPTGTASTPVSTVAAGTVTLTASVAAGQATATFTVLQRIQTISAANPSILVAEASSIVWALPVALTDNSGPISAVPLAWTATTGLVLTSAPTSTNAQGAATASAVVGPIAAGQVATARACAWVTVCTSISATGVGAGEWRLAEVSGTAQSVSAAGALAPVTLRVTDPSGNPIAGAPVQILQTVSIWQPACLDSGRCPLAAVYGSANSSAVSGLDGTLTLTPAGIPNSPSVTRIAVVTGTQGFASFTLEVHP